MAKIVKDINIKIANKLIKIFSTEIITKNMIYDLLDLKEKELKIELAELKQQQLFKEDFDEYCQYVNGRREDTYIIKEKSLYKKLPSKEKYKNDF